jgi:arylsulfatase A
MNKRFNLQVYLLALAMCMTSAVCAQNRPNIVFILADDLGYKDLGCYGNPFNETPHLDSMAQQGMKFTQAYSSSPVCSPSRAGLLTGRHPARLKITNFLVGNRQDPASLVMPAKWKPYLSNREVTIAEVLSDNGYTCGMVGKWHLGSADSLLPSSQGFAYERMIAKNGLDYYNYSITEKNKTVFEDDGKKYLTDKLTDYSIQFINDNKDKPFFLYLAYSAPHIMLVPRADKLKKYFQKSQKFNGQYNENYAAMIESMDEGIGQILQALRKHNLDENTIVIFTSDNGGLGLPELGPRPTSVAPLRAWKGHVYEGGIRVPLIVYWEGKVKAGSTNTHYTTNLDFFPTLANFAGARYDAALDGKDISGMLMNPGNKFQRGEVFWHYPHFSNQEGRPSGAMRSGRYKLVELYETGRYELYDLEADESEAKDLSSQSKLLNPLVQQWQQWKKEVAANMPEPNPDYKKK